MKRMKKISFVLVIVTVLVCCLLLSGCGCKQHIGVGKCTKCGKDFFELLKKHCKKNGEFKSDAFTITYIPSLSSEKFECLFISYYPDDEEISMFFQYDESNIMITMEEIDGIYPYIFGYSTGATSEYVMKGTLIASQLSGLTRLSYTSSTAPSLLNSSLANLACNLSQLLTTVADLYFLENNMPIRCVNLGFDK